MPPPRSAMRKIREVLRLTQGLSWRRVAAAAGMPVTTVAEYVQRAAGAGLSWPLPEDMDDLQLEARLFVTAAPPPHPRPQPDWMHAHAQLRRKGVALQLLHLEYLEQYPDGYQHSQFCRRYRLWQRHLDVVVRQEHRAGEKLFVDFPDQRVPILDRETGLVNLEAEVFVAVLGAGLPPGGFSVSDRGEDTAGLLSAVLQGQPQYFKTSLDRGPLVQAPPANRPQAPGQSSSSGEPTARELA